MKPLYEIDSEFRQIMEQVESYAMENEGEITDELESMLESASADRQNKIMNVALYAKNKLAEAEMIKTEKQKLAARQSSAENTAERLKKYLSGFMQPGEKFELPNCKLSWRKSETVEVADATLLPENMQKITIDANKTEIKKLLKAGSTLNGCKLITKQNLQVR